ALLHQDRPAAAATLLQGGARRRVRDPALRRVVGYGFRFAVEDGTVRIPDLQPNSPAARSKLLPGDVVVKINGVEVTNPTLVEVQQKIVGAVGTKIRLTVRHAGSTKTEDVELVKETYLADEATGQQLSALRAAVAKRLAKTP